MKTRNPVKKTIYVSQRQFEEAISRYAVAERREAELCESRDTDLKEVMDKYEDEMLCLSQIKNAAFDTAHAYCLNNKEQLFGKRRTIGALHGIAGFRLGTPRLKTLKGTDWNNVLTELKTKLPDYVRTTVEPAKDQLLADRQKEKVAPLLREIGLQVVQDELFYIETKKAA
jgi:phage host-nuclease inhibitor protein Gam